MRRERQSCTSPLPGTWKLQSFTTEDLATGQKTELFGAHPTGYLSYGPDLRMYAILVTEGRHTPVDLIPTDTERINLYNSFSSYAVTYSIEGDLVSHYVDAAWNQAWTGTTQVRQFRIDGKLLSITTLPARNPVTGKECISGLLWTKLE